MTGGQVDISADFDQSGHLAVVGCAGAATQTPASLSWAQIEARAADVVARLGAGDYLSVIASFDPLGRTYIDAGRLQTEWQSFEKACGAFATAAQPVFSDGFNGVDVPVNWTHASSNVLVYFDGNYQLSGLSILLPDVPPTAIYGSTVEPTPSSAALATTVVNELARGLYGAVIDNLDPLGAAMTSAADLHRAWQTTTGRLGKLHYAGTPVLLVSGTYFLDYQFDFKFEHGSANVQVYVDGHGHVGPLLIKSGAATGIAGP